MQNYFKNKLMTNISEKKIKIMIIEIKMISVTTIKLIIIMILTS